MKELIEELKYADYVHYVKGSVMVQADLARVLSWEAAAVFVFSNQFAPSRHLSDIDCVLAVKCISKLNQARAYLHPCIPPPVYQARARRHPECHSRHKLPERNRCCKGLGEQKNNLTRATIGQ